MHDDIVRVETITVLNGVEVAVVEFREIFREVAGGAPLDPRSAEQFVEQCGELIRQIVETRNAIRLSARSHGVH
jgi:hypothetical protein